MKLGNFCASLCVDYEKLPNTFNKPQIYLETYNCDVRKNTKVCYNSPRFGLKVNVTPNITLPLVRIL